MGSRHHRRRHSQALQLQQRSTHLAYHSNQPFVYSNTRLYANISGIPIHSPSQANQVAVMLVYHMIHSINLEPVSVIFLSLFYFLEK
jgi:hypothetical protein